MHKTRIIKATAFGGAVALFAGVLLGMPSIAAAAEPGESPAGTTADWAATAPWAAVRTGGAIVPANFKLGSGGTSAIELAGSIEPDFAGSNPVEGASTCNAGVPTFAGLGAVYTSDGSIVNSPNAVSSTHRYAAPKNGLTKANVIGEVEVIVSQPEASVTVPIQSQLDGQLPLTGRFYITDADAFSGVYRYVPGDAVNQSEAYGHVPYTVTPVPGGVRFDFDTSSGWQDSWHGAAIRVAAELADGSQGYVMAHVTMPNYGGAPAATSLGYATHVGQTLEIPREDLLSAVSWRTGFDRVIAPVSLPETVTETADGFRWTPVEVGETAFEFTGSETQFPVSHVLSNAARVSLTALPLDDEEPEVPEPQVIVAPTVRDFEFTSPQAKGNASTGANPAEVPVLSLTEGEDFDPGEWFIEASDVMPWRTLDSRLYLFPEVDGAAFETRWRWTSLADPSVSSEWATVSAPAALPAEEEPPLEEPQEPQVPAETPVVAPKPEESVAPAEPGKAASPALPKRVETGDAGSPTSGSALSATPATVRRPHPRREGRPPGAREPFLYPGDPHEEEQPCYVRPDRGAHAQPERLCTSALHAAESDGRASDRRAVCAP